MRRYADRNLTEEELTVAVLSGEYNKCYWCGKYYHRDSYDLTGICSDRCEEHQFNTWQANRNRWRNVMKSHGAPDHWISTKG